MGFVLWGAASVHAQQIDTGAKTDRALVTRCLELPGDGTVVNHCDFPITLAWCSYGNAYFGSGDCAPFADAYVAARGVRVFRTMNPYLKVVGCRAPLMVHRDPHQLDLYRAYTCVVNPRMAQLAARVEASNRARSARLALNHAAVAPKPAPTMGSHGQAAHKTGEGNTPRASASPVQGCIRIDVGPPGSVATNVCNYAINTVLCFSQTPQCSLEFMAQPYSLRPGAAVRISPFQSRTVVEYTCRSPSRPQAFLVRDARGNARSRWRCNGQR